MGKGSEKVRTNAKKNKLREKAKRLISEGKKLTGDLVKYDPRHNRAAEASAASALVQAAARSSRQLESQMREPWRTASGFTVLTRMPVPTLVGQAVR